MNYDPDGTPAAMPLENKTVRVAVIGANGQLGTDLCAALAASGTDVIPLTSRDADVRSPTQLREPLLASEADVVVNTAAMHHVERCEQDPTTAFQINALGALNVARIAAEMDAKVVYISTDYVFNGVKNSPYTETDVPAPLNVYGNTKLSGEDFVRATTPKHLVMRTTGLYGHSPCRGKGENFVELMLRLASERGHVRVVDDEILTPTSTRELARQITRLLSCEANGLFHATAEGQCSWFDFAAAVFELAKITVNLEKAAPGEFPTKVPRPAYSALDNRALKDAGLNILRPWRDGLATYIHERER